MKKVAINGFGRIGRLAFRQLIENNAVEVAAVNDLNQPDMLAYLLKYDTAQGVWDHQVDHAGDSLLINGKEVAVLAEKDPANLPWKEYGIDLVLECTGLFASRKKSEAHLDAGAGSVLISAPAGSDVKTIVFNVNHDILKSDDRIVCCASCTTNGLAPVAKTLHDNFGLVAGQMSTIHAYTNSQKLVDTPDTKNNFRGSRAAAGNIVPYSTGAAKAIGLVIPELNGRLDGSSQRVPTLTGSVIELFTLLEKTTSVEEVNAAMKAASNESFGYTEEALVSSDITGMTYGSLFDATQTKIVSAGDKQLVKTAAWYDNEISYVTQLVRTVEYMSRL